MVYEKADSREHARGPRQSHRLHVMPRPAPFELFQHVLDDRHTQNVQITDIRPNNDEPPRKEPTMKLIIRILLRLLYISASVRAHTRRQGAVVVGAYKRRRV